MVLTTRESQVPDTRPFGGSRLDSEEDLESFLSPCALLLSPRLRFLLGEDEEA